MQYGEYKLETSVGSSEEQYLTHSEREDFLKKVWQKGEKVD